MGEQNQINKNLEKKEPSTKKEIFMKVLFFLGVLLILFSNESYLSPASGDFGGVIGGFFHITGAILMLIPSIWYYPKYIINIIWIIIIILSPFLVIWLEELGVIRNLFS